MVKSAFSLDKSQRKEFAKYWLDLSKIAVGSLIAKFFDSNVPTFTTASFITLLLGLTLVFFFAILGLRFAKEKKW